MKSRGVIIFLTALLFSPVAGFSDTENNETPTSFLDELELNNEILFRLRYGDALSLIPGVFPGSGSFGIHQGLDLDDLIKSIFISQSVDDRIFVDIDYDSDRDFLSGGNLYSLLYRGDEGFVREITAGNRSLAVTGTRHMTVDQGSPDAYALRFIGGRENLSLETMLRYGIASQGRKKFRGNKQVFEDRLFDGQYIRRRYFFLPDVNIDASTLQVLKSDPYGSDAVIDGNSFTRLLGTADYTFNNAEGWITLRRGLSAEEDLVVAYEKNAEAVGSLTLGINAIIDNTGVRTDFNQTAYPEYFSTSGGNYLYLYKTDVNSYWELKNGYPLDDLPTGGQTGSIYVELLFTDTHAPNSDYQHLLKSFRLDPAERALFFMFQDGTAFYPRPFPGEIPYDPLAAPYAAGDRQNPFDAEHPLYGGLADPDDEDSLNTLVIRYTAAVEQYFLDYDIIPGSLTVILDGLPLSADHYSLNSPSGTLSFAEGVISPASDIEVSYQYSPAGGGGRELLAAVGVGYANDWLDLYSLTALTFPLVGPEAPLIGAEQQSTLNNSTEATVVLGAAEGETGFTGRFKGGLSVSLNDPNVKDRALIASMSEGRQRAVGLHENSWLPASRSQQLVGPPYSLPLSTRGDLYYENYREYSLLFGEQLQEISWDNSGNPSFTYSQKTGPYNSADQAQGGDERSLVLDFAFANAVPGAYTSIATDLGGVNLEDLHQLNMVLRGDGISGDTVRIYVEVLGAYQEDLNGNDALEGESSLGQPGFTLTPIGGTSTVIGSDPLGEGNGSIESEDLNRNGKLDPVGPFGLDLEKGQVITGSADHVAEFTPGDDQWHYLSIDMSSLVAGNRAVFQNAQTLRISVTPVLSPTIAAITGKILINRLVFTTAGIENNDPVHILLREVAVDEDPTVENNAFSSAYPDLYEELYGKPSYREDQGHREKVLQFNFAASAGSPLSLGSEASIRRSFASPQNFALYEQLKLYLYLPSGETLPSEALLLLALRAGSSESLNLSIDPGLITTGWNEITVDLGAPFSVQINQSAAGEMALSGSVDVLNRITAVDFGVRADSADLTSPFVFWLDEWHLSKSRLNFDGAFFGEATIGYRGALLNSGSFPILENVFLSGGYELKQGVFAETAGRVNRVWFSGLDFTLLKGLNTEVQYTRSVDQLNEADTPEPFQDSSNYQHRLQMDTDYSFLPVLEHRFQRSRIQKNTIELTPTDSYSQQTDTVRDSVIFSENYTMDLFTQNYSFSRNWLYERQNLKPVYGGIPILTGENGLNQIHKADFSLHRGKNSFSFDLLRDETVSAEEQPDILELFDSYAQKMASLFTPLDRLLDNGEFEHRLDKSSTTLHLPLKTYLGSTFNTGLSYNAYNFIAASRDVGVAHTMSVSLPFSPIGSPTWTITPRMDRSFRGSYDRVSHSLEERQILAATLAPLYSLPLTYLHPNIDRGRLNAYKAVDLYAGAADIQNSDHTLNTGLSIESKLKTTAWILPSKVGLAVSGETIRQGSQYAQTRTSSVSLGKSQAWTGPGSRNTLAVDLGYALTTDFARKTQGQSISADTAVQLVKVKGQSLLIEHFISYDWERLHPDDSLVLYPGHPEHESPVLQLTGDRQIDSALTLEYAWSSLASRRSGPLGNLPGGEEMIRHVERLTLDNSYTLRTGATQYSNLPFRISIEHDSVIKESNFLEFALNIKLVGGIEDRFDSGTFTRLASFGFEAGLQVGLLF